MLGVTGTNSPSECMFTVLNRLPGSGAQESGAPTFHESSTGHPFLASLNSSPAGAPVISAWTLNKSFIPTPTPVGGQGLLPDMGHSEVSPTRSIHTWVVLRGA